MPLPRLATALALLFATTAPAQDEPAGHARFKSINNTFYLDLPSDFRQLAPNEALELSKNPATPSELTSTSPRAYYAVGPVDKWLGADVQSPWLYVVEYGSEWYIEGDFAEQLQQHWQSSGEVSGMKHDISDVREAAVGPQAHVVHLARRTQTPASGRQVTSLDVYAATGGREVTLSFCAWADDFERLAPEFDKWLETLTFSRPARGRQSLSDRLWTPLITGGIVGIILLVLYKHTRRSR